MLQSLRDNLKGTVAVIVITIFAVPMVLFGVEQLFVGSLGGDDVAMVDDTPITRSELTRAIYLQKQRILSQSEVDPNSDFLKDENLRGPVLESLTRHTALVNAAQEGGMGVSETALWQEIADQPQFQVDGKFNNQRFRQIVSNMGYTPATYLEALSDGVMVNQQTNGIESSSFLTTHEMEQFVALAQQTRSFFSIAIPSEDIRNSIEVSDEEIGKFYEDNQNQFQLPERVALNYVEIDLDNLAERQEVKEADIRAQYEQEMAAFVNQPQYEISHILIEEGEGAAEAVTQVQAALAEGQDFAEVAREFSDDLGTKDNGGFLGRVVEDAYPEAFEAAVYGLEEGEVSGPVKTDAGTHLIKADKKIIPAQPTFADRKDAIERQLRRSLAEQALVTLREQLDELTYSASDLQQAAKELNLEIKTTELFSRNGGTGFASHSSVQEAAFSTEVLEEGHNSRVLELPASRLAVVRVVQHEPERVQPLAEIKEDVKAEVLAVKTREALADIAQEIKTEIAQGAVAGDVAESRGYAYAQHPDVSRSTTDVDRAVVQRLFSLPRPAGDQPVTDSVRASEGDLVVIGLTGVTPGSKESLEEAQLSAMRAQLSRQMGSFEAASYENQLVSTADIQFE